MQFIENETFSECIETLDNLERYLIEYEEALESKVDKSSLIHIIFRNAHNMKSILSLLKRTACADLIHSVENNFDRVRSGELTLSIAFIDKCLKAVDLIKHNLTVAEEETSEIDVLKQEIDAHLSEKNSAEDIISLVYSFDEKSRVKLLEAKDKGFNLFQIEKLINSNISKENFEQLPIYKTVEQAGIFISRFPDYENINREHENDVLKILFATEKSSDELFFIIFDPYKEIPFEAAFKKSLKILIIEDEEISANLLKVYSEKFGFSHLAGTFQKGIELFEEALEQKDPYNLIFLDMLLPDGDGHDALNRIRRIEDAYEIDCFDRTRVIICSVVEDLDSVMATFREQADGYLIKPAKKEMIEQRIKKVVFGY